MSDAEITTIARPDVPPRLSEPASPPPLSHTKPSGMPPALSHSTRYGLVVGSNETDTVLWDAHEMLPPSIHAAIGGSDPVALAGAGSLLSPQRLAKPHSRRRTNGAAVSCHGHGASAGTARRRRANETLMRRCPIFHRAPIVGRVRPLRVGLVERWLLAAMPGAARPHAVGPRRPSHVMGRGPSPGATRRARLNETIARRSWSTTALQPWHGDSRPGDALGRRRPEGMEGESRRCVPTRSPSPSAQERRDHSRSPGRGCGFDIDICPLDF
jgi:hypothetical protein